jgi:hypothetical protein
MCVRNAAIAKKTLCERQIWRQGIHQQAQGSIETEIVELHPVYGVRQSRSNVN